MDYIKLDLSGIRRENKFTFVLTLSNTHTHTNTCVARSKDCSSHFGWEQICTTVLPRVFGLLVMMLARIRTKLSNIGVSLSVLAYAFDERLSVMC